MLKRFPGGIETKPIYQKRVPREAAGVAADRGPEVPVRARGGGARAGRRRAPAVGGLARQRGLEPASGAALRPRPPRRAARRHRPDARRAVGPRPPRRAARRRGAARARARRLPAHVGLARDAHHGPHPPAVGLHDRARGGAGAGARGGAPRRGDGDLEVVEGGAPAGRGLRRLQPERQGPHRRGGVLDPPGARRARRVPRAAGTRCRTASSATSASTRCRSGCGRSATRAPRSTRRRRRWTRCWSSARRDARGARVVARRSPAALAFGPTRSRARRRSRPGAGVPGGGASPGPAGRGRGGGGRDRVAGVPAGVGRAGGVAGALARAAACRTSCRSTRSAGRRTWSRARTRGSSRRRWCPRTRPG